jgi:hypothetical protein
VKRPYLQMFFSSVLTATQTFLLAEPGSSLGGRIRVSSDCSPCTTQHQLSMYFERVDCHCAIRDQEAICSRDPKLFHDHILPIRALEGGSADTTISSRILRPNLIDESRSLPHTPRRRKAAQSPIGMDRDSVLILAESNGAWSMETCFACLRHNYWLNFLFLLHKITRPVGGAIRQW